MQINRYLPRTPHDSPQICFNRVGGKTRPDLSRKHVPAAIRRKKPCLNS